MQELHKEVSSKKMLLMQLERSLENLKGDVETSDLRQLDSILVKSKTDQENLETSLSQSKNQLIEGYEERRNFENMLEQIRGWVRSKAEDVLCPNLIPLRSEEAEKVLDKIKRTGQEIKQYFDTNVNNFKRQGSVLFKDCDEDEKDDLHDIISEVEDKMNNLCQTMTATINRVSSLLDARIDFEKEVDTAQKWLHQAEVAIQTDIKSLNTADVLAEQLKKLETLEEEKNEASNRVSNISSICEDLLPYLTDADKFSLGEIIRDLQDKTNQVNANISDKTEVVRISISQQRKTTERMLQITHQLTCIQKEVKGLNRPVGRTMDDAQALLLSYQDVHKKVNDFRKSVEEMQRSADVSVNEIREMIKQQQDLIINLEKQITRIRQLILVRQHFNSLTTEINAFIQRYATITSDIEKTEKTTNDKLRRYNEVITRIQETEALLTSAQDKGNTISDEGTVEDRNAIMEQLQNLKGMLNGIRREIERKQQDHGTSAESHKRLQVELNTALEWLMEQESELKTRPLLTLEVDNADEELESHEELSTDIEDQLQKVHEIMERAKSEIGLPYILQERLSEAKMVTTTFPYELESRKKYLKDAKMLRLDYEEFNTRINTWVSQARKRLHGNSGFDFETVRSELEEHLAFFSSEALIGDSLEQLGQTAERIVPSLASEDQDKLTKELQKLTKDLDDVTKLARNHKSQLEKNVQLVVSYKSHSDKVRELISGAGKCGIVNDALNIAALRSNLQKIDEERNRLYKQSSVVQDYTDKANELLGQAEKSTHVKIGNELLNVTKDWKTALENIEVKKDSLRTLISQWQDYDVSFRALESALNSLQQKITEVDSINSSGDQIDSVTEIIEVSIIFCLFCKFI